MLETKRFKEYTGPVSKQQKERSVSQELPRRNCTPEYDCLVDFDQVERWHNNVLN